MRIKTLHIPNSRLTEGKTYSFTILNTVSLGPGDTYYVMQDPLGYKIMMPAWYYDRFGFNPGQMIDCRVDKINCSGRMFLEPAHPHYKEGNVYSFDVVSSGGRTNILQQQEWYLLVRDVLGYEWTVMTRHDALVKENPSHVKCRLNRIKKGKLYLQTANGGFHDECLNNEETQTYLIVDEKFNPDDGLSCFIVRDETGGLHLLRKKYYLHYGLKKGLSIRCRPARRGSDPSMILEPEHPCYQIGEVYGFEPDRLEQLVFSDGSRQFVLVLRDCFGEEAKVHISDEAAALVRDGEVVKARVLDIYKSRLELELLQQRSLTRPS